MGGENPSGVSLGAALGLAVAVAVETVAGVFSGAGIAVAQDFRAARMTRERCERQLRRSRLCPPGPLTVCRF